MEQITHTQLVANLAKPGADVIEGLTPLSAHLLHMAVGTSGEVSELLENFVEFNTPNQDNIIEELGDIEFYVEAIRTELGILEFTGRANVPVYTQLEACLLLQVGAGKILDTIKKHAIYVKPLDTDYLTRVVLAMDNALAAAYAQFGLTRERVIQANIDKLSQRYSSGSYSNQQAQDRADKDNDSEDQLQTDSTVISDEDQNETLDSESEQLSEHSLSDVEQNEDSVQGNNVEPDSETTKSESE